MNNRRKNTMKRTLMFTKGLLAVFVMLALIPQGGLTQKFASDPPFKVKIDFNRWHDTAEMYADMRRMEQAWPKFVKVNVIGKSFEGRDIIAVTINNPDTGPDLSKAAMLIEANVHGNEIQGGEICLYTVWYLMENYGRLDQVTRLVNERVFYIIPTINPDGRQYFFESPSSSARSGHVPVDDDSDYQFDEDKPDDLNGNGVVEQMRKYLPGKGNYRLSATDPRVMEAVPFGEKGDYIMLGSEGIDNDHDGRVDEDDAGGYDGNRNYPFDWQPNYIQSGAMDYPTQLPEAKAEVDFIFAHPNIAGAQSYHNNGGMILRGPGAEAVGDYPASDIRAYDELGRTGERILPFYRYIVIWSGLYTVHGGFIDWTNDGMGILSFSNELWSGEQYFTSPELKEQQKDPNSPIVPQKSRYFFNDKVEFGAQFMEWKKFNHPQFGEVEIGGTWRKFTSRVPPRFMNEELCHRNMAFTLVQAAEMPMIRMGDATAEKIGGDVYRLFVDIANSKVAPTILERVAPNGVIRPDLLTLDGKNVEVISASWIGDEETYKMKPTITQFIDQKNLKRIMLRNGLAGKTARTIMYIVKGSGEVTVKYDSVKGGSAGKTLKLQ
ncbi:MAG: M14 family metallopeptidase [Candidatus Aminicenantes bacterium]|nr:M14 family metallopeptidase [Candidatus Aminicenantes bacterium]